MECLPAPSNLSAIEPYPMRSDRSFSAYPKDGVIRDPAYLDLWEMEKRIDLRGWAQWHDDHWHWALVSSAIYLVAIFGIKEYMRKRQPYNLREPLIIWNAGLAIFSIAGFLRCFPGFLHDLSLPNGLHTSICSIDTRNAATVFWGIVFGLSKIVELGDTIFIVLRKQPLIFLHYYHHVTVLCYVWLTAGAVNSATVWFGIMNYGIHSLMYSYYSLKALQVKIPKTLAMTITALQLLQMVIGVGVNLYVLAAKYQGRQCATLTNHVYYGLLMYGSYFLLFAKFFLSAYLTNKRKIVKSQ